MGGGHSTSSTTNTTSVSTADVKDAFNRTFSAVTNLSDVGNTNAGSSSGPVLLLVGLAGLLVLAVVFIKKG